MEKGRAMVNWTGLRHHKANIVVNYVGVLKWILQDAGMAYSGPTCGMRNFKK